MASSGATLQATVPPSVTISAATKKVVEMPIIIEHDVDEDSSAEQLQHQRNHHHPPRSSSSNSKMESSLSASSLPSVISSSSAASVLVSPTTSMTSGRASASPFGTSGFASSIGAVEVSCQSCNKAFDRRNRIPRLLDCIHSVCQPCLYAAAATTTTASTDSNNSPAAITSTICPLCNRVTSTAPNSLPLDVVSLAMSETCVLQQVTPHSNCPSCSDAVDRLCWDCSCGMAICQKCYDAHVANTPGSLHSQPGNLIPIPMTKNDDFYRQIRAQRNAPCPTHPNGILTQYCVECNCFICADCISNGEQQQRSHQRHHLVQRDQFDSMAGQHEAETNFYRGYIDHLRSYVRAMDQMWPALQERADEIDSYVDNYETQTRQLFANILERIEFHKKQALEATQRVRSEREAQFRNYQERLTSLIITGERLIHWMTSSIDVCNAIELAAARTIVGQAYQMISDGMNSLSAQQQGNQLDFVVQHLPRLPLFENAILNILSTAENANSTLQAPTTYAPVQLIAPNGSVVAQSPQFAAIQQRQMQPMTMVPTPINPYISQAPISPLIYQQQRPSMTLLAPHTPQVQLNQTIQSPGSFQMLSPAPMGPQLTTIHSPWSTPSSFVNTAPPGGYFEPSPITLIDEPPAPRIKRTRMIYHLKFGEFGVMDGQFTEPSGIACNAQNDIIVADTNNHRVQIFDNDGRFKFTYGEGGGRNDSQLLYPNRVAVYRATGDIVITERAPTHQVQIYDQYGIFVRRFGHDLLRHPRGVCVDAQGRILVVECKVMRVSIFSIEGRLLKAFTCESHVKFPNGIAANSETDEIYISDNRAHCVWVFNYDGVFLHRIGGEGVTNYPIGVGINQLGEIVITDNHNNLNLTVFSPDGSLLYGLESKVKHAQVFDSTLTNDGSVAIACKDYRVYVYRYMSASTRHLGVTR